MIEVVSPWIFGGVSLAAAILNATFLIGRAWRNYRALIETRNRDEDLRRIGSGFIFTWSFIVFADLVRTAVGLGYLVNEPKAIYLLLLTPFGSLLVAVVGLRSFR